MVKLVDRVIETTQTTGTGTLDLGGAQTGYRAFSDELTSGDKVYYCIEDDPASPTAYEVGIGTWTSGSPSTLSRDTVLKSSNGGSKISLESGTTYTVTGVLPAEVFKAPTAQTFTASGTYTKPARVRKARVTVVGGGGGGAAASASVGGGGGGAGGTAIKWIDADSIGTTETVTIGAAGAAGGDGGASSFGAHCSATGGAAGGAGSIGGAAGTGSSGDVNYSGGGGHAGNSAAGGNGGTSFTGGGGRGWNGSTAGEAAAAYGAGGGGGGPSASAGGTGAAGLVIVEEFY